VPIISHIYTVWRDFHMRIAADACGIRALVLGGEQETLLELESHFPNWLMNVERLKVMDDAMAFLEDPGARMPDLTAQGTAFQHSVWDALTRIPSGNTTHYASIAASIGRPKAARAVAAACAANPIAILVPCHRVVRSDGSLSGYRWGEETKAKLLESERRSRPAHGRQVNPNAAIFPDGA
jgi:AraC family transcriptional regulator of adaptative response/methylated-DNA-[protein]-cysteine methyltransferase